MTTKHNRYHRGGTRYWTRELLIEAIQEFARIYGRAPRAIDWNVSMARKAGRDDLVARFLADDRWPHASNVYGKCKGYEQPFATWNDAIRAAGLEPRAVGKYDRSQVPA